MADEGLTMAPRAALSRVALSCAALSRAALAPLALRLCLCLLLLLSETGRSEAQGVGGGQLQKEKKALERIRQELEEKRKGNRAVLKQEATILSALAEVDRRLRLRKREVGILERAIQAKDAEQAALSGMIQGLNQNIRTSRSAIAGRLRTLYKERVQGLLSLWPLFRDDPPDPPIERRLYYLHRVAEKEERLLAQFTQQRLTLREKESRLADTSRALGQERASLGQAVAKMREEKERKDQLLIRIQDEKAFYAKEMVQLDESAVQLQKLIRGLEEKKKEVLVVGLFSKKKGHLGWPNDGKVAALFGRQKHPRFNTYVNRKGIDIAPSENKTAGAQVRAVSDGVVVYADGFRGYDRVVIIDHGENYYSVYAHLAKLWVDVGERVQTKRPIGEVGEMGPENRLYFEIRHQGKPLDPITWLQKRE